MSAEPRASPVRAGGPPRPRIGIIDTDRGFLTVLDRRLRDAGWPHRIFSSAVPVEELSTLSLDALVLDPAVLGSDGEGYVLRVCGELPRLGVIVCTLRSTVAERARALRQGVDDWLTKPCHAEELMARIQAVLRRHAREQTSRDAPPGVFGALTIDPSRYEAFVAGHPLRVTRREYDVLRLLSENAGQVVPREEIYERVWGYSMVHGDRSVDVFVRKIREKLERASPNCRYIHTHFGIGYRFHPEPVTEA